MPENQSINTGNDYINFHAVGIGYLQRVREVSSRRGKPWMSAAINVMHGEKGVQDGVQYTPMDVKAVTEQSEEVLRTLLKDANDRSKRVMVHFKSGDMYIDTFQRTKGQNAGQIGTCLKGRLITVFRAWVQTLDANGKASRPLLVYERPRTDGPDQADGDQQGTGTEG